MNYVLLIFNTKLVDWGGGGLVPPWRWTPDRPSSVPPRSSGRSNACKFGFPVDLLLDSNKPLRESGGMRGLDRPEIIGDTEGLDTASTLSRCFIGWVPPAGRTVPKPHPRWKPAEASRLAGVRVQGRFDRVVPILQEADSRGKCRNHPNDFDYHGDGGQQGINGECIDAFKTFSTA